MRVQQPGMLAATPSALRRAATIAVSAALLATLSDLTLLRVSSAAVEQNGIPSGILMPATYVGALAILLYSVGYWQVACGLVGTGERLAGWVFVLGAATAGVGAVIHGMTGITVRYESLHGGNLSPARMIALLWPLWALGIACNALGMALYASAVLRGTTVFPRWMAAVNPVVLPVVISALALLGGPRVRGFVVPASANIGHAIFFALAAVTAARSSKP